MRDIKFRGMDKETKRWYYGSYWKKKLTTYCFSNEEKPEDTEHFIIFDKMTDWGLPNEHYISSVIPSTVCEFTGMKDKNGSDIYEHDIVSFLNSDGETSYYTVEMVRMQWRIVRRFEPDGYIDDILSGFESWFEVVGNIFENPELIDYRCE